MWTLKECELHRSSCGWTLTYGAPYVEVRTALLLQSVLGKEKTLQPAGRTRTDSWTRCELPTAAHARASTHFCSQEVTNVHSVTNVSQSWQEKQTKKKKDSNAFRQRWWLWTCVFETTGHVWLINLADLNGWKHQSWLFCICLDLWTDDWYGSYG